MNLKNNIKYNFLSNLVPLICAALLIPFLKSEYGNEKFGFITLMWAMIGYFGIFDLGVSKALNYYAAKAKIGEISNFKSLTLKLINVIFVISLLASFFGILFSEKISILIVKNNASLIDEIKYSLVFVGLSIPATTVSNALRGVMEGLSKFKDIFLYKTITNSSFFWIPALVIVFFDNSVIKVAIAYFLIRLISLIWMLVILKNEEIFINNKKHGKSIKLREVFNYSSWILLSSILSPLMVYGDRFLISTYIGVASLAIYAILQETIGRSLIASASISGTIQPKFTELDSKKSRALYFTYSKIFYLLFFLLYAAIALFSPSVIGWWLKENIDNYIYLIYIFSAAMFFNSLAQLPYSYLLARGKPNEVALIHVGEFFVYLPCCFILVYQFGVIGAALAWLLRVFLDYILLELRARKL